MVKFDKGSKREQAQEKKHHRMLVSTAYVILYNSYAGMTFGAIAKLVPCGSRTVSRDLGNKKQILSQVLTFINQQFSQHLETFKCMQYDDKIDPLASLKDYILLFFKTKPYRCCLFRLMLDHSTKKTLKNNSKHIESLYYSVDRLANYIHIQCQTSFSDYHQAEQAANRIFQEIMSEVYLYIFQKAAKHNFGLHEKGIHDFRKILLPQLTGVITNGKQHASKEHNQGTATGNSDTITT